MNRLNSFWINIIAAVVGGVSLGWGIGRLAGGAMIAGGVWTIIGAILLWWSFADRRKWRGGSPESEVDGSRTIE
jgi:hypothetical protein